MPKYVVHKAVEVRKVKKKLQPTENELRTEYLAQPKYDGCCCVVIKEAHAKEGITILSRTGETVHSAEHIKESIASAPFAPLGVYFGEYWHPEVDQSTVSGWFRDTKAQHPEAFFVVWDYVSLEEYERGESPLTYQERVQRLPSTLSRVEECKAPFFLAEGQGFLIDQELGSMEAARMLASSGNFDGIILRKPSGLWRKGDLGTSGEVIKVKPTLTLDLSVIKVNVGVGEKTSRKVYTIVVRLPDGKEQEVGAGVPHTFEEVPLPGHIVEIEAMCYSKYGLLREPRFKGIRYDKLEADSAD